MLTTHAPGRLNPPLPVDEDGNWYRGVVKVTKRAYYPEEEGEESAEEGSGEGAGEEDDGLTDGERAILADLEQLQ